jgi:hypothetical protein
MEVKRPQSFVGELLLAQSFDALRAPSRIEFTFFNAISRRKAYQGSADQSASEA